MASIRKRALKQARRTIEQPGQLNSENDKCASKHPQTEDSSRDYSTREPQHRSWQRRLTSLSNCDRPPTLSLQNGTLKPRRAVSPLTRR